MTKTSSTSRALIRGLPLLLVVAAGIALATSGRHESDSRSGRTMANAGDAVTNQAGSRATPHTHCCSLRTESGFADLLRPSNRVVFGRLGEPAEAPEGEVRRPLTITRALVGPATDAPMLRFRAGDPHAAATDTDRLWFLFEDAEGGETTTIAVETLPAAELDRCAALLAAIAKAERHARNDSDGPAARAVAAAALVQAITNGGPRVRELAARDFTDNAAVSEAIDVAGRAALRSFVSEAPTTERALSPVLETLALHPADARLVPTLLTVLDKPGAARLLDSLVRIFRIAELPEGETLLAAKLRSESDEASRLAGWILAGMESPESRAALAASLDNRARPDHQAAALVAFASAAAEETGAVRALSLARDVLRKHSLSGDALREQQEQAETPIGRIARRRAIDALREQGFRGEAARLAGAGFYLARRGDKTHRAWLAERLDRLDDPAVARFIRTRLQEPWTRFDAPW